MALKRKPALARWIWLALALGWMVVIFVKSGEPYTEQDMRPRLASYITEQRLTALLPHWSFQYDGQSISWEMPYDMAEFFVRKAGHVTEFAILTWLWLRALWGWTGKMGLTRAAAAAIAILYAMSDEWHQTFVSGRTGHAIDVVVDTAGVLLAIALQLFLHTLRQKKK